MSRNSFRRRLRKTRGEVLRRRREQYLWHYHKIRSTKKSLHCVLFCIAVIFEALLSHLSSSANRDKNKWLIESIEYKDCFLQTSPMSCGKGEGAKISREEMLIYGLSIRFSRSPYRKLDLRLCLRHNTAWWKGTTAGALGIRHNRVEIISISKSLLNAKTNCNII